MFAAYALVAGAVTVLGAVKTRGRIDRWWLPLLLGIVSLAAGTIAVLYPAATMLALVLLAGANALVTGVVDVIVAVRLRKRIQGEWLLITSGIVSIFFGVFILLFPTGAGGTGVADWQLRSHHWHTVAGLVIARQELDVEGSTGRSRGCRRLRTVAG